MTTQNSNCCYAPIYIPDLCSMCKEHCGVDEEEGYHLYDDVGLSPEDAKETTELIKEGKE